MTGGKVQTQSPESALTEIKDGGKDGGAASDEVISTLAHSSPEFRNQVFNSGKDDPALLEEMGLVNATDLFLSGDAGHMGDLPVPPGVDVRFSNDGHQDVMIVTEGNTRSYLGKNGEYQTFEFVPGENGQPGTVKVNSNGMRTEIAGVTDYNPDGAGGAPVITTEHGQSVVKADGSVETTMNNGVHVTTDGTGSDGITGNVIAYKNPAANIDIQIGSDRESNDGKHNVTVSLDGTLAYTSEDGWRTKVAPDGKEVRSTGTGLSEITEYRDKPGGDVTRTQYGPTGANDRPFSPDSIAPSGIDQTRLGDCWFMSSVAALAETPEGRKKLSDMIKRNEDGSYTVTFPGDKDHPVTVSGQEVLGNPKINDDAVWAKVMEAAILKRDPEAANSGGKSWKALDLLTDQHIIHEDIHNYMTDTGHLAETLQTALAHGEPIVVGSRDSNPKDGPVETNHDYTVTGYDPKTGLVTVRNPWGHNDLGKGNTKDGVTDIGDGYMTMSLETFQNDFARITYGGQPKSAFQQTGQVASEVVHDVIDVLNPANWF